MARSTRRRKKRNGTKSEKSAPRRVKSLQKFLRAYGRGSDAKELREAFARRCGTKLAYLVHLAYGYRTASEMLAVRIEQATHRLVSVEDIRPDIDWAYLASRKAPAAQPITTR